MYLGHTISLEVARLESGLQQLNQHHITTITTVDGIHFCFNVTVAGVLKVSESRDRRPHRACRIGRVLRWKQPGADAGGAWAVLLAGACWCLQGPAGVSHMEGGASHSTCSQGPLQWTHPRGQNSDGDLLRFLLLGPHSDVRRDSIHVGHQLARSFATRRANRIYPKGKGPSARLKVQTKQEDPSKKSIWIQEMGTESRDIYRVMYDDLFVLSSVTFASTDSHPSTDLYHSINLLAGGGATVRRCLKCQASIRQVEPADHLLCDYSTGARSVEVKCMEGRDATSPSRNVNRSELTVWYFFDAAIDPKRLVHKWQSRSPHRAGGRYLCMQSNAERKRGVVVGGTCKVRVWVGVGGEDGNGIIIGCAHEKLLYELGLLKGERNWIIDD
ncbi:uncharacterized protein B0T23DRAFT_441073 [Neurospora hispaniola]|uniref:Uncharacterized protein n=1 Tax=Neurospora hispaniola TaxID=588809 RepID=A0AAJ0IB92_9PEZI|nr:hypothetical protein B0T23DRAFT_441073 [Neurospora hispaniola]